MSGSLWFWPALVSGFLLGALTVGVGVTWYVWFTEPDDGVRELARQKLNEK